MSRNEAAIRYEKIQGAQKCTLKSSKERLRNISGISSRFKLQDRLLTNKYQNLGYLETIFIKSDALCFPNELVDDPPRRDVPLHSLLEYGAIVLGIICFFSLLSWVVEGQASAIVNPFAAILLLLASPFIYLMGKAIRRKQ